MLTCSAVCLQEWYWVSYDLDRQQVAIITFDPRLGHGDVYQRELLDYRKVVWTRTRARARAHTHTHTHTRARACAAQKHK